MRGLLINHTGLMPLVRFHAPLGYLFVYLGAFLLGRLTVVEGSGLALFWPAAGIGALWMLRGRTRRQVALDAALLFVSTTVLLLFLDLTPGAAVLFGTANLVEGLGVRAATARLRGRPMYGPLTTQLTTSRGLLKLAISSMVASMLSFPFATAGLRLTSGEWSLMNGWVVRNYCSTFVVVAVAWTIMGALRDRRQGGLLTAEPRHHSTLELLVAMALTLTSGLLVFSAPQQLPLAYLMIATSAWIGFRFAPLVGAVYSLGFGTLALLCTLARWGPFGLIEDPMARAIAAQLFVAVTTMIVLMIAFGVTDRFRLTTRLRASEERASSRADLVDAVNKVMSDGLCVIDANGTILLANPAAEQMAGLLTGPSHLGSPESYGLLRLDGTRPTMEELPRARALRGEDVPPMDLLRIDPTTGQQTVLSISATPLRAPSPGEPAVAVLVLRDVTKARAQSRELENFAGVVAHDLKTPLTGVVSWTEILEEQLDEAGLSEAHGLRASVDRIRGSADRMAVLIRDLLEFTQTQKAELTLEAVSLDEVVDQIAHDLRDTHHHEIPVVEHAPLGTVMADRTLVRQLLTNVIGNAVKYVAPGVVPNIVIGSAPIEDMLEIWVSDNGIGIGEQDLGRVFDTFFRAPSSTQDYPGTGLGLAICALTVERHGGRISARQRLGGQGTTMLFTLPLEQPAPLRLDDQPDQVVLSATA